MQPLFLQLQPFLHDLGQLGSCGQTLQLGLGELQEFSDRLVGGGIQQTFPQLAKQLAVKIKVAPAIRPLIATIMPVACGYFSRKEPSSSRTAFRRRSRALWSRDKSMLLGEEAAATFSPIDADSLDCM